MISKRSTLQASIEDFQDNFLLIVIAAVGLATWPAKAGSTEKWDMKTLVGVMVRIGTTH